jgi:hypothetical protein
MWMDEKKMNSRLLAMLCNLDLIYLILDEDDGEEKTVTLKYSCENYF